MNQINQTQTQPLDNLGYWEEALWQVEGMKQVEPQDEIIEGEIILYDIVKNAVDLKKFSKEVRIELEKLKPNDIFIMEKSVGAWNYGVQCFVLIRRTPKMCVIKNIDINKILCYEEHDYYRILEKPNYAKPQKILNRKMSDYVLKIGNVRGKQKDIIIKHKNWSHPKDYLYMDKSVHN